MDITIGAKQFRSERIEDPSLGFVGYELLESTSATTRPVARAVYVDAAGDIFVRTYGLDVPARIVDLLVRETALLIADPAGHA